MGIPSRSLSLALCVASLVDAVNFEPGNWTIGQVVQTSSGSVFGHPASVYQEVSEYLGIPYAVPPVGNLRWTTPQMFSGTDPINGTDYGFSCPAVIQPTDLSNFPRLNVTTSGLTYLSLLSQTGDKFDEDCITINVWTKPQSGEVKKAVLVWIYGGEFSSGKDVVLVSFNYRLNIFGFPGIPDSTQNLGLLDQRLAIEWVQKNIEAFGGDASRITLFGQSAGGASVDYYTYAWTSDPIAHGFIEESGSLFGPAGGLGAISAEAAASNWFNLTNALGCVDEMIVFSNYKQRSISGNLIKLPLLLGTTNNEAGLLRSLDGLLNLSYPDPYWNAFNDFVFVCPCSTRANISISNRIPTWRYGWFAWHSSELAVLFNNTPNGQGLNGQMIPNNTEAEIQIGSYMRGACATFAKDPMNGLKSYQDGRPQYDLSGNTLVRFLGPDSYGKFSTTQAKYI
ncbi:Alpha/Beta hydrolase protein [Talaromyces proteolyticus]|uniref:Carboxylic ester hydrolase n=1 Tax=Talaromyces proteolyticus TaxID=1131652 RepID=A0AAD4L2V4_9EURO|nr:Alpha/Beta hydrolase protein [Talaromyces proteolyticus]KAH8702209.1 Alpha/Beta hydrolase protein [Talaromyces proteolyticus]